ncbi:MAG: hypothetical protein V7746_23140 [Halioglobus sp.]
MKAIAIKWTHTLALAFALMTSQLVTADITSDTIVPAGTSFLVRTGQTLSTDNVSAGHRFTARLEADLVANGVVVAPRGSTVYGVVTKAQKSGRLAGKATLAFTLTDIMINNQMRPIVTSEVGGESANTGGKSAGTTARAAAIGGLADGSSGAKTGAKVGLGVSLLTRGNAASVPSGSLLDFRLQQPFSG